MGDKAEMSDAQKEEYKEAFDLFDTDKSGKIDASELQNILNHIDRTVMYSLHDAEQLLERWDQNGDQQIDFDEFCEIMSLSQQTWEQDLMAAFKVFDVDGDGDISRDEICSVLADLGQKLTKEELKLIMDEVDLDKNGTVDFDEFKQMMSYGPKGGK